MVGSVWGQARVYRGACFNDMGNINFTLGWDTLDVLRARTRGWKSQAYLNPKFYHNRKMGSRDGILKGKMQYGKTSYLLGYHICYFISRLLFNMIQSPYLLGSLFMLWGYIVAAVNRVPLIVNRSEKSELHLLQKMALIKIITMKEKGLSGYSLSRTDQLHEAVGHV
jgi:hypothetical protein